MIYQAALFVWWGSTPFFCVYLAHEKHRNPAAWFVLGLFFNAIALVTLVGLPMVPYKNKDRL